MTTASDGTTNGSTANQTTAASVATAFTSSATGPITTTTTKKKFGKNLNKLTAPPTAPSAQTGTKSASSSKNGLLLLSSKRPSSGANAAGASTVSAGTGILSTKTTSSSSKPLPSLGLHTEYNPSTHDALMGVVVGAARMESQQQPDAWGVAEKQNNQTAEIVDLRALSTTTNEEPENRSRDTNGRRNTTGISQAKVAPIDSKREELSTVQSHDTEEQPNQAEFRSSNWDEYGGRGQSGGNDENGRSGLLADTDKCTDMQNVYMAKLAKERAEARREEEERRLLQQKQRAAQRLRELEEKMASKQEVKPENQSQKITENAPLDHSALHSSRERTMPRKLFDPNEQSSSKSFSAIARGSSSSPKQSRGDAAVESKTKLSETLDPKVSSDAQPVIQLTSYDDTDRGNRGTGAGPRMLFDPKSGSMVEVSSREDPGAKTKKTRRGRRKKGSVDKYDCTDEPRNETKTKIIRKEDVNGQSRERSNPPEPSSKMKRENRKGKISVSRMLPRTCGVLFSRDRNGNFVSSDKCDGDLGYGVHSVPGGKVKNPDAYSVHIQSLKQAKSRSRNDKSVDPKTNHRQPKESPLGGFKRQEATISPVIDWVKPNEKIELITGVDESPTLQATAREWAPSSLTYAIPATDKLAPSSVDSMDNEEEDYEHEPFGLGFDPTLNMDSMMQSPSMEPSHGLDSVDLTSLSLGPGLQSSTKTSHSIFAFETGSTWANSNAGSSNDWTVPTGNGFANTSADNKTNTKMPSSFLALPSGNAWGGFGNTLNSEHSSTPGD